MATWSNPQKWIVRHCDDKNPNIHEFQQYFTDYCRSSLGSGLLHFAAICESTKILKYLLSLPLDPNQENKYQQTPLHYACSLGKYRSVKLLHKRGADLWHPDYSGNYPLHCAAESGCKKTVRYIISQGVHNVDLVNKNGLTPLEIAYRESNKSVFCFLVNSGASVDKLFDVIVREDNAKMMKALAQCSPKFADELQSHLQKALKCNSKKIVALIKAM